MTPLLLLTALCALPISGDSRIIGGQVAAAHSRPYMVSLQLRGQHFCGGSLIYPDWVLTAAHCMEDTTDLDMRQIRVVLGAHEFRNPDRFQQVLTIRQSIPHPGYNATTSWKDMHLLRLNAPANITTAVQTIALPPNDTDVAPGSPCSVAGWGYVDNNKTRPTALMEADVNVIPCADCIQIPGRRIYDGKVCAAGPGQLINGFCSDDSGGPLVCRNRVEGVASFSGVICGNPDTPDVYTRVSSFLPWIQQVVNRH